jgi:tetratricopeptide (TPR) repeat protein
VDDRSVTLIIEGPGFVMAREVPMRHKSAAGVNAQVFASQVTAAGQHSYPAAPRPEPAALPSSGWTGNASAPGSGAQGGWPRADSPEVLFNRGIQFQQHGDLLAAQDAYRRAVASGHPEAAPLAALNLGVLLGQQGHVAGAEALFRIAIDSYHRNAGPLAALNLGDLLWDRGDTSGAKAAYQQAVYSNHHRAASKAADRLAGLP